MKERMKIVSKYGSNQKLDVTELEQLYSDGAGYDILRYIGLPELFGEEKDTLLKGADPLNVDKIDQKCHLYQLNRSIPWD